MRSKRKETRHQVKHTREECMGRRPHTRNPGLHNVHITSFSVSLSLSAISSLSDDGVVMKTKAEV